MFLRRFLAIFFLFLFNKDVHAQCISSFPYRQDFDTSNGNWLANGDGSSWVWGAPRKQVITAAASGAKCWIAGGVNNGDRYNNRENSWIESPCYDFTSLTYPQISAKIFWETERNFDGACFEYSTDNGQSWYLMGTANDNNGCAQATNANWYNVGNIPYLGNAGWSGNMQTIAPQGCVIGGGSGSWLLVKHNLLNLAGQPNVKFRFRFSAGNTCNSFDGFAFDEVTVSNAPPETVDFIGECKGNDTLLFVSTASICALTYSWNFDDPSTGIDNTSTQQNALHAFSNAGLYNVSLTVTFPNNVTKTVTKQVNNIRAVVNVITPLACGSTNPGVLQAQAQGDINFNYVWNTTPVQTTQTISNLTSGTYTVTVSGSNGCSVMASATLANSNNIAVAVQVTNALCGKPTGNAAAVATNGTSPYNYVWSTGATTSSINNLSPGNYSVSITDAANCTPVINNFIIKNDNNLVPVFLGNDTTICPGSILVLDASAYTTRTWQDGTTTPKYNVTQTGKYSVAVSNADDCTRTDTINVTVDCSDVFFPTGFTPDGNTRNDMFGPLGNVSALKHYTLRIYNRWGYLVFETTDSYKKWDGKINGVMQNNATYIWVATYNINNNPAKTQKGSLVLMR